MTTLEHKTEFTRVLSFGLEWVDWTLEADNTLKAHALESIAVIGHIGSCLLTRWFRNEGSTRMDASDVVDFFELITNPSKEEIYDKLELFLTLP